MFGWSNQRNNSGHISGDLKAQSFSFCISADVFFGRRIKMANQESLEI